MSEHKNKQGLNLIPRIILPLLVLGGIAYVVFNPNIWKTLKVPASIKDMGISASTLPKGMLSWAELEKQKRYTDLDEALKNPTEVKILDLSGQHLKKFPTDIALFTNLQILDLQNNRIQEIPNDIQSLNKLQYLYLRKNQISKITPRVGNLTFLKHLDLSVNQLVTLFQEIGNISELQELDITDNKIIRLPEELIKLKRLKILRTGGNALSELPQNITKLDSLETFDISRNTSLEIRPSLILIGKMKPLRRLEMKNMGIVHVPNAIENLKNIRNLNFQGNRLTETEQKELKKILSNVDVDF